MEIDQTPEYKSFRSSVSLKKTVVEDGTAWSYYDAGPRSIHNPIIFLPPVSGTADIFFRQLLTLSGSGYRAIAVNHPTVWNVDAWCQSFNTFLNSIQADRVHIFGASLGGFLAQKFAEFSGNGRRVRSMILCNAFNDTDVFKNTATSSTFWAVPAVVLKKLVLGNFDTTYMDREMVTAVNFMVLKLDTLSQQELASRLTLNCVSSYVEPQNVQVISSDITLMNVFDEHALSNEVHNEMNKLYPNARKGLLKSGGNFPYLSRSDEVNIYIQVHLQQYADTIYSAGEPRGYGEDDTQPSASQLEGSQSTDDNDAIADFNTSMAELETITEDTSEAETGASHKEAETSSSVIEHTEESELSQTDQAKEGDNKDTSPDKGADSNIGANNKNSDKNNDKASQEESNSGGLSEEDNAQVDTARIVEDFEINSLRM